MIHLTQALGDLAQIILRAIGMSVLKLAGIALTTLLTSLGADALTLLASNLIQVARKPRCDGWRRGLMPVV